MKILNLYKQKNNIIFYIKINKKHRYKIPEFNYLNHI